ncbi:hypothetical protein HK102_013021 [Quaeritorhiza haematococci]|nr:hypothetical protein HK102_013021 [Quaeritorhiza haematococci]
MNYIKGFRYQLYCVARALGTPHCVMYCGISKDKAREWNTARQTNPEVNGYDSAHFEELIMRFEEPEARNRWDSPLFTVIPDDGEGIFDAKLGQEIVDAVILRKPPAPNLSTVVKPLTETNYLYEMDRMTQDIINAISAAQRDSLVAGVGGQIAVPYTKSKVTIPPSQVTMSELRRLRRQYCQINKLHTQIDKEKVASGFVDYLNTNLGS